MIEVISINSINLQGLLMVLGDQYTVTYKTVAIFEPMQCLGNISTLRKRIEMK